jgi:quercetin dioxygenase-like cupin family protein
MYMNNYRDIAAEDVEEGAENVTIRWLISKDTGADNFSMRLFEIAPNGHTPLHDHPWEHEVFVLEGEGMITASDEEKTFKEGDVILLPPNETHQFRNNGESVVKFICLIPNQT